jgi:hypothetical protein
VKLRPEIVRAIARAEAGPCLVCGAPGPCSVGVFEPDSPELYCPSPPEPGKIRALFYGLCPTCLGTLPVAEIAKRIEERLRREQRPVAEKAST